MSMEITKRDSEIHDLLSQLFNQHATWNGLPTQNVGALDVAFKWFNEFGQRIDQALEAEAQAKEAKEAKEKQAAKELERQAKLDKALGSETPEAAKETKAS